VSALSLAAVAVTAAPISAQSGTIYFGFNQIVASSYDGGPTAAQAAGQETAIDPSSIERLNVNWAALQPTCVTSTGIGRCIGGPGAIQWSSLDSQLQTFQNNTPNQPIRVELDIDTSPIWAWNPVLCVPYCDGATTANAPYKQIPPSSAKMGYFSDFITQLLERYADPNNQTQYTLNAGEIVGIEVWNEENSQAFWQQVDGASPSLYASMLCDVNAATHAISSTIPVIMGGLAYETDLDEPTNLPIPTFIYDVIHQDGAGNCMQAIAAHPYTTTPPDSTSNTNRFSAVIDQVNLEDATLGYPNMPIWITEFGYSACSTPNSCATEIDKQGDWVNCAFQLALGMPNIAAFIVFQLNDEGSSQLYGIYTQPGSPKVDPSGPNGGWGGAPMLSALFNSGGGINIGPPPDGTCATDYWTTTYGGPNEG
jgi:hypothetical protein